MTEAEKPWSFIITMAGLGSRFRNAGFDCPKYMIEVRGKTLFEWSMLGLMDLQRPGDRFVFVARKGDDARNFITHRAEKLGIQDSQVVEIDGMTDGQATTAMLALPHLDANNPIAIFNIDTGLKPGVFKRSDALGNGWIPCFRAPGNAWSFCRIDVNSRVVEVREKARISDFATIGLYWFDSAKRYAETYARYYGVAGREEKGERYVAPIYNQIISDSGWVSWSEIDFSAVIPLGTPDEVLRFETMTRD
jgi:dTDP-glucose pyrophosphorylase